MPPLLAVVLGIAAALALYLAPDAFAVLRDIEMFLLKAFLAFAVAACGVFGLRRKGASWPLGAIVAGVALLALATLNLAIRIGELGTY